jgi:hypothetical protein
MAHRGKLSVSDSAGIDGYWSNGAQSTLRPKHGRVQRSRLIHMACICAHARHVNWIVVPDIRIGTGWKFSSESASSQMRRWLAI